MIDSVSVSNVLSVDALSLIEYYCLNQEKYYYNYGDMRVPNSHEGRDGISDWVSKIVHPIIEDKLKTKLFPTYSYYRVYRSPSFLLPHTDRPECEVSASICIAYNYDITEFSWPLVVDNQGFISVPGDMVIYSGDINHYRPSFEAPKNSYHIQVFTHYVYADGDRATLKYDGRPSADYPYNYRGNT